MGLDETERKTMATNARSYYTAHLSRSIGIRNFETLFRLID